MSANLNVYTAVRTLPIDDILEGLRGRGVDAEWDKDETFSKGKSWDAGRLTTPAGDRVDLSVQKILPGEKRDLVERAKDRALAEQLTNSYRLRGRGPTPLLWALADSIAALTPSVVLDPDSNILYDPSELRRSFPGAPSD
jgi:hypothetical protein